MDETLAQPELQLRTLRWYGELMCRRDAWAHRLVVACFDGAAGMGMAAAASLAGAASLTVDGDAARVKAHFRDGAFDFVVNTLDEALRAIKNEVRKGKPIAIGLMGEPDVVRAEMEERGVVADFEVVGVEDESSAELCAWLSEQGWVATEAVGGESFQDAVRARWMEWLPTHQRSLRGAARWTWSRGS
ncbi:MAG: hypothetical protein V4555_19310 [Acidobacteriota bacterium]